MFHLVSFRGSRRTQVIPRFGGVLQECVDFTWREFVRVINIYTSQEMIMTGMVQDVWFSGR